MHATDFDRIIWEALFSAKEGLIDGLVKLRELEDALTTGNLPDAAKRRLTTELRLVCREILRRVLMFDIARGCRAGVSDGADPILNDPQSHFKLALSFEAKLFHWLKQEAADGRLVWSDPNAKFASAIEVDGMGEFDRPAGLPRGMG